MKVSFVFKSKASSRTANTERMRNMHNKSTQPKIIVLNYKSQQYNFTECALFSIRVILGWKTGDNLSWLMFEWFSSIPPGEYRDCTLNYTDRFLLHRFQFNIHYHPLVWCYAVRDTERIVKWSTKYITEQDTATCWNRSPDCMHISWWKQYYWKSILNSRYDK